jgi:hypothetical protein
MSFKKADHITDDIWSYISSIEISYLDDKEGDERYSLLIRKFCF